MKRTDFNSYIQKSDFVNFFNELGWNHVNKSDRINPLTIDGIDYDIIPIADKQGFKVLTCNISELPQHSIRKKIDTQLRRYFHNYILIFKLEKAEHHLWMIPIKTIEKRELVIVEYSDAAKADFLFAKINGFSFDFDEETNIIDVTLRVHKAFEINSAKITKSFYSEFRKQHTSFEKFIKGVSVDGDRQWYASVMLNRLMFCYFIQKKGFLDFDEHYLSKKLKWTKEQRGKNQFFGTFYKGFLSHLFRGGLNNPKHDKNFEDIYGKIPYLNGGIFDEHELERQYQDIDIPDDAFENLFNFFDDWCWHLDTRITATGKDINPDVLGYIFEQYINQRAQMGAYYTKEDITEYIGKNCILPFLMDEVAKTFSKKHYTPGGFIWETLRNSGDTYIYDAVKKGTEIKDLPAEIAVGLDATQPNLLERRKEWNKPTPEAYGLPTEIWRETIERRNRYLELLNKIRSGEITQINDFITYNLDIRRFVEDLLIKTDDHQFVLHFYKALQNITILDPTCGSGAFLFAALNILEPLYEICISRMQEFNAKNLNLFKEQLDEIDKKYRSNIQYFIYKSIILRNLYGVDIMHEATEIARLRLFLKMVAVVDVDKRAENLGLDPLPDIDFNIRCGNTLIGYTTEEELNRDLSFAKNIHEVLSNQEFKKKIEDEMEIISRTYSHFKSIQLNQQENIAAFKQAKDELTNRLKTLNETLNQRLHQASSFLPYDEWLKSHQPFHWVAEFYQIIKGNGGFDVIIGNPPYVNKKKIKYKIEIDGFNCSDIYGYVIQRCFEILKKKSRYGFIVMHNLAFSKNFEDVRSVLKKNISNIWFSFYARIPAGLFSGDVRVRNCIFISEKNDNFIAKNLYTTRIYRWVTEARDTLFVKLKYTFFKEMTVIPMYNDNILVEFFETSNGKKLAESIVKSSDHKLYFKQSAYNWIAVSIQPAPCYDEYNSEIPQSKVNTFSLESNKIKRLTFLFLNGKLFFSKWLTFGDEFDVTCEDLFSAKVPFHLLSERDTAYLLDLSKQFEQKINNTIQFKLNAGKNVGTFNTSKLWNITDKSDKIFLKYLCDNSKEVFESVENHVFQTIRTLSIDMGNELNGEEE